MPHPKYTSASATAAIASGPGPRVPPASTSLSSFTTTASHPGGTAERMRSAAASGSRKASEVDFRSMTARRMLVQRHIEYVFALQELVARHLELRRRSAQTQLEHAIARMVVR